MTPQEEIDLLLRVVTRLAQKQVEKGGFIPSGAVLGSNREIQLLMPGGWKKDSTRDEAKSNWYAELRKYATTEVCKTVCFCADVGMPIEVGEYSMAVNIYIEHPQAEAAGIFYPYSQNPGPHVEFGKPTTVNTDHQVFSNPWSSTHGST